MKFLIFLTVVYENFKGIPRYWEIYRCFIQLYQFYICPKHALKAPTISDLSAFGFGNMVPTFPHGLLYHIGKNHKSIEIWIKLIDLHLSFNSMWCTVWWNTWFLWEHHFIRFLVDFCFFFFLNMEKFTLIFICFYVLWLKTNSVTAWIYLFLHFLVQN